MADQVAGPPPGHGTACAQTVVAELVALGVREAVLAPGSRSAPLAYALDAADRDGRLRLHVRVDERTAGFLALGLAKASGGPVAVVTTSGTAVANLHPAVLEAWHAHVPVVVVTADRPQAMVNTGANQTTHQDQLFTQHLRARATLSDATEDQETWRFETARLVALAVGVRSRTPGPVHLNVQLSDPLTPTRGADRPSSTPTPTMITSTLRPGPATVLEPGPLTVVLAGDARPEVGWAAAELAATAGIPLLAEPSSNARAGTTAIATYRLLLASPLGEAVERVVLVGHPTLSRPVTRLLSRAGVEFVVVSPYADWPDPGRNAHLVTDAVRFAEPGAADWLRRWQQADAELGHRLDRLLAEQDRLSGPAVARTLWAGLTGADVLFAGSSNPIRDLDLAARTPTAPVVYANRGLSGIDGSVSSATGVALAAGRPAHALLGDVTTVHDLTGLVVGPGEPRPDLRLVVVNDDGGSIFATLEQGDPARAAAFERVFATPHGLDFAPLADAVGAGYRRVSDQQELSAGLGAAPRGLELVEVRLDRTGRRRLDQQITGLAATL